MAAPTAPRRPCVAGGKVKIKQKQRISAAEEFARGVGLWASPRTVPSAEHILVLLLDRFSKLSAPATRSFDLRGSGAAGQGRRGRRLGLFCRIMDGRTNPVNPGNPVKKKKSSELRLSALAYGINNRDAGNRGSERQNIEQGTATGKVWAVMELMAVPP